MILTLHLGLHCTETDQLMQSLRKCRRLFGREGVALPEPHRYRVLIAETLARLNGAAPDAEAREALLDAILADQPEALGRAILVDEDFLAHAAHVFDHGGFYAEAGVRAADLRRLFTGQEVEFTLSVRNPASFVPALVASPYVEAGYADFLQGADPAALRWSQVVGDIALACPDVPVTVWAYEDTPLIWAQVIRDVAGLAPNQGVKGGFDMIQKIIAPEGMRRLRAYLRTHPVQTEIQVRRVFTAFLDKYVLEDELEEEIALPGWTEELVERMTLDYEEDLREIERIPNVSVIAP